MKSVRWKCRYCSNYVFVAAIMTGRRVRCPACGDFSVVRPRTRRKRRRGWQADADANASTVDQVSASAPTEDSSRPSPGTKNQSIRVKRGLVE